MIETVYLLSDYEEHGAENVEATLDATKLYGMLEERIKDYRDEQYKEKMRENLKKYLSEFDELDGRDLGSGWGGIQLHIVKIQ